MEFRGPLVPVGCFVAYSIVFAIAVGSPHRARICLLPAMLLLAGCSFWTMSFLTWPEGLSSLWGLGTIIHVFHGTSVLYIKRLSPYAGVSELPTSHKNGESITFGIYKIWQDPQLLHRRCDTGTRRAGRRSEGKTMFVGRRVIRIITCQMVHRQVAVRIFPGLFIPLRLDDFAKPQGWWVARLLSGDWVAREWWRAASLRVALSCYWLWAAFAMLETAHSVLSIAFVSTGLDRPEEWANCFGKIEEAYTIRRFWSRFWHQMATAAYSSHAGAFTRGVLGLREGSRASKTVRALVIFLMSGATHAACSWRLGDKCGWRGDIWFFAICFGAIGVESVVGRVNKGRETKGRRGNGGERGKGEGREEAGRKTGRDWGKVIGYVWVCGFFVWAVPEWQYEKVYCGGVGR